MPIATYDNQRERWAFLHDSYRGGVYYKTPSATRLGNVTLSWHTPSTGDAINTAGSPIPRNAVRSSYLTPHDDESDRSFDARHTLAAHIPIVAPVVKAYAESVTANVVRSTPGVPDAVMADANRRGLSWDSWVDESARWLALFGIGFAVVDAPAAADGVNSLADERASGVRPYVHFVFPSSVALVECDEWGTITRFAYADEPYYPRETSGGQSTYSVCLREWSLTAHEGAPGWRRLRGTLSVGDNSKPLSGQMERLHVEASGPLPPQLGGRLPVVAGFYEPDSSSITPQGISLVDDVADIERLVYNLLSWINEIHRAASFPFLTIPSKGTGGALDPNVAITLGPTRALPFDGEAGTPQWIQPSAESTKELREHVGFLFTLALRTAGLEVAADASAQVQSGEALRVRSRDFDARCARFAGQMAAFERAVLRLLAMFAGAGDPGDAITVEYAKRFTLPDPSEDLARAVTLLGMRQTVDLGDEATVALLTQALVAALPAMSPADLDAMITELRARFSNATAFQSDAMSREAAMQSTQLEAAAPKPIVAADEGLPEIFAYHIEMGIVTVNEVRERLGFPPLPTGNMIATIATTKAEEAAGVVPTVSEGEAPPESAPPPTEG